MSRPAPLPLTDPDDPRVTEYTGLTDVALRTRYETGAGLYMAESSTVIRRAVAAGHVPRSFLMAPRWLEQMADVVEAFPDAPVYTAPESVLEGVTGFHLHRGALAAMNRPALAPVADVVAGARRVAIIEDVVDHTNVGAIFRSAAGIGVDVVLVTPSCADPLYRRSVRVSMGTVFQVPWTRVPQWPSAIADLRAEGFVTAALALSDDAVTLDELADARHERLALVLGSEGHGLKPATVDASDVVVRIPMAGGVDSLNVAAASAVAFWATRR
ncbi:rRNA methyltransferase [Serinibacter arcticus]|uniref:rRNA methyltransferase n=1 Tax=Serinibacter arcticus TaxID=1655435 RepID=A0A2U1ZZ61_9MICO|nr:RNA methyltransferase [Serinibacter arcticus]PWD52269.1 rRNA methyltransferase [Serinibacter arcticus]